jgi:biopolymer transport protein ExbD
MDHSRKIVFVSVAVLTFYAGTLTHLVFQSGLPDNGDAGHQPSARVLILVSARERLWLSKKVPGISEKYLIVSQNVNRAPITEAVREGSPDPDLIEHDCGVLYITVDEGDRYALNGEDVGTLYDLRQRITPLFQKRIEMRAYLSGMGDRTDLSDIERIPRTVILNPSGTQSIGQVVEAIDMLREAHANPIALRVSDLTP